MDPDILATPSEAPSAAGWNATGAPAKMTSSNGAAPLAESAGVPREALGATRNGRTTIAHSANGENGHASLRVVARSSHDEHRAPANGGMWTDAPRASVFAEGGASVFAEGAVTLDARAAEGPYQRWGKRALDVTGAAVALVLSSPLLALAALAIKLESPGPVFYRSTRIGRDGRPFTFLKLRSMIRDADRHRHQLTHLNECDGPVFKISRDPRMTRVGRFLRTTSIDEIPQFLNVLAGDMSLVGPRPPIPEEVAQYEPWQLRRLDVRPGITCLWQISGRSRIGFQEWMRLDLEYIKRRSFWLDLKILLRTIPAVLSREGAY
jgi:lipopolysaccharide/colanic/teichoic acid biosynthesis glycosyltransferase